MKNNEQLSDETFRVIQGLRLLDDNFMTLVFDQNFEATELVLNIILQRDDLKVISMQVQKDMPGLLEEGRGLTMDIYAVDSDEKVYDIEVQRSDEGASVQRARYHSATIDTRLLKKNQKFKEIHDSYVIFITENDVLGGGLPIYHSERYYTELAKPVNDGNHIIYVNAAYENNENAIGRLMHDFRSTDASDMFFPELSRQMKHYKETEGGVATMCRAFEEYGEKKRLEALLDTLKNIMDSMKWTADQAMAAMKVSEEDQAILKSKL